MIWLQLIIVSFVIITAIYLACDSDIQKKADSRVEYWVYSKSVGTTPKVVPNPDYKPRERWKLIKSLLRTIGFNIPIKRK